MLGEAESRKMGETSSALITVGLFFLHRNESVRFAREKIEDHPIGSIADGGAQSGTNQKADERPSPADRMRQNSCCYGVAEHARHRYFLRRFFGFATTDALRLRCLCGDEEAQPVADNG